MIVQRSIAVILLLAAAFGAASFPFAQIPVAVAALVLATITLWQPWFVFVAVAVIIPALDLTPWSGRFYFNEFDIWMLAAIGGAFWSSRMSRRSSVRMIDELLIGAVVIGYLASTVIAVNTGQATVTETVNPYFHPWNGLRAAKGLCYAMAVWTLLCRSEISTERAFRLFTVGTTIGLASTVFWVAVERLRFSGLFDSQSDFRVTGPFADMHFGGAALDTYLVMAIPLLACLWWHSRQWAIRLCLILLWLGSLYATSVTVSRTPVVIVAIQTVVLAAAAFGQTGRRTRLTWKTAIGMLIVLVCIGAAFTTKPLRNRFSRTAADLVTRAEHWQQSLATLDDDWRTRLFGVGNGGFSKAFQRHSTGNGAGGYALMHDDSKSWLRLTGPLTIYMGQTVSINPDTTYRVELNCRRQSEPGNLTVALVEKSLLYAFEQAGLSFRESDLPMGQWTRLERTIDTGSIGKPVIRIPDRLPFSPFSRSVVLSFWVTPGSEIDIDNIELFDDAGNNLVDNHDFENGHDRWWWTSDDHLIWHAKNLWVHLLVEQGWFGMLAFSALMLRCLCLLVIGFQQSDPDAIPLLAALAGFVSMGTIDSVIDSPRITIFCLMLVGFVLITNRSDENETLV